MHKLTTFMAKASLVLTVLVTIIQCAKAADFVSVDTISTWCVLGVR